MGRSRGRWRGLLAAGLAAGTLNAIPMAVAQAQEAPTTSAPSSTAPSSTIASSSVPPPASGGAAVSGPLAATTGSHDAPLAAAVDPEALADHGYIEEEVFLEGTATVHGQKGAWGPDGRWATTAIGQSPYKTRLLVRRPADDDDFDGTVVVSWLNVGGAFDRDADWTQIGEELMRTGAAWVGVSAQRLGIEGLLGARRWDPQRYSTLSLASDALSYDIFTQAGQAIRTPGAVDPLGGLPGDRRVIATGQSQSAQRLVTYINAFHPAAEVFDAFLVISRFRGAAPLGNAILPESAALDPDAGADDRPFLPDPLAALLAGPTRAQIREDTDVPVLVVLTETEAVQDAAVGRPDSDRYRTWEVAGAAHLDRTSTAATVAQLRRDFPSVPLGQLECAQANRYPVRYALRAAVDALDEWVEDGDPPSSAAPLARDGSGEVRRDADGNALGGLRLPDIDVPTARHSGDSAADGYCGLTGATVPFPADVLSARYPSPEAYVSAVTSAAKDAVAAGHLLQADADELVASASERLEVASAQSLAAPEEVTAAPGGSSSPASASAGSAGAASADGAAASAPEAAPEAVKSDRGWMATTGRDLITPVLIGLLLLLNGRVVLTIANQRRRRTD